MEDIAEQQVWTVQFPAYRLEKFIAKMNTANKRLAKAGADCQFTYTTEQFMVKRIVGGTELDDGTRIFGTEVEEPWVRATLPEVTLTLGDWTFVASLVREEAGYTVHCAPGQDLSTWVRPEVDDVHCDHCGTNRNRTRLYVIRENTTGKLIQLGHSCIELYLGLSPKGLWALAYDAELKAFADEDTGRCFGAVDYRVEIRKVLAYGFIFSDRGRSYVSRKAAWEDRPATAGLVSEALFVTPRPPQPQHYRNGGYEIALAEYEQYLADIAEADRTWREDGWLLDDIIKTAETLDGSTDYGQNMAVILAGSTVSGRNVGILASLVAVYARHRELAIQRAAAPEVAKGYLAEVGVRIKSEIVITLKTVRHSENDFGQSTWLVGFTPDQHMVTWSASRFIDMDPGDTLTLSAATVKAHKEYKGIDQTVLTRCKIIEGVAA